MGDGCNGRRILQRNRGYVNAWADITGQISFVLPHGASNTYPTHQKYCGNKC